MIADADTLAPLVFTIDVPCAPAEAFRCFTEDIGQWWPLATHSVGRHAARTCAFEPHLGGALVERTQDGAAHAWGTVTHWDPPCRLAFTWHPGRGPETAQSVDVLFAPSGAGTTVTLTHDGWAALGDRAGAVRDDYRNGWQIVLRQRFADYVRDATASAA